MTMKTLIVLFLATLAHTFAAAPSTSWLPTGSSRPDGTQSQKQTPSSQQLP